LKREKEKKKKRRKEEKRGGNAGKCSTPGLEKKEGPGAGTLMRLRNWAGTEEFGYQLTLRANWNWRAS
jgi:hypothetical protein